MCKQKHILRLALIVCLSAALLAGCSEPKPAAMPATAPASALTEPPDTEPKTEPSTKAAPKPTAPPATTASSEQTPGGTVVSHALADAVRQTLNVQGEITDEMLNHVTKLEIYFATWENSASLHMIDGQPYGLPVSDLSGLEACENLQSLSLIDYYGTDLSPVGKLSRLTELSVAFAGNLPSDLLWQTEVLADLPLERLAIDNYPLSDLTDIGRITTLRELWLTRCPLNDLSPLQNLASLEKLNLGRYTGVGLQNRLTDIAALSHLNRLNGLRLSGFSGDLSPLAALPLTDLSISQSTADSFAPLASLTRLINLCVTDTNFTDGDTAVFQAMKSLRSVLWVSAPEGAHPEALDEMLAAIGRTDVVSVASLMSDSTLEAQEVVSRLWEAFAIDSSFWPDGFFEANLS